jgi:serine/threonine protein kinase
MASASSSGSAEYDTKIAGGGSMYVLRRVDTAAGPTLKCLGAGSSALTMDGFRCLGAERVPVAVKQISVDSRRAADLVGAQEQRGLEALAGRSHANIVGLITSFSADEGGGRHRLSFVFERCPTAVPFPIAAEITSKGFCAPVHGGAEQPDRSGCDLFSNPHKTAPFSPREAVHIIRQVLSALAHLHAAKPPVLHRDVKPENILIWDVRRDDARGDLLMTVKLTDYGTMRRIDRRDLTVGTGTRCFMASEVDEMTGTSALTNKPTGTYGLGIDIFSAGATLFWLVTGESPSGNTREKWRARLGGRTAVSVERSKAWYKEHRDLYDRAKTDAIAQAPEMGGESGGGGGKSGGGAPRPAVPTVTTLDFFFPLGSGLRTLLEGLVEKTQFSPETGLTEQFTADSALEWIAREGAKFGLCD